MYTLCKTLKLLNTIFLCDLSKLAIVLYSYVLEMYIFNNQFMYAYIIYMDVEIDRLFCSNFVQSQIVCLLKLHGGCFHCPRYLRNMSTINLYIKIRAKCYVPELLYVILSLPLFPFVKGEVLPATFSPPHLVIFSTLLCHLSSSSSLPPLLPSSHLS